MTHQLTRARVFTPNFGAPFFAVLTIALNILWPLTQDIARQWITIAGVIAFFISTLMSCIQCEPKRFTLKLLALMPLSFAVEAIGVHTHFPFGTYSYSNKLGPTWCEVPLIIPMAWVMMLYPTYLACRTLVTSRPMRIVIGAWLMATWDLYLDPQMIHEGYWTWFTQTGAPTMDIPLTNFLGWFATSALFMWLLHVHDASKSNDLPHGLSRWTRTTPKVLLLWVWLGSFVANIMPFRPYLDRPAVALTGFVGMGIALVPWSWRLWSRRS